MTPTLTVFINLGMVLVVWLGGAQAIEGKLSLGRIVAFTNYLLATMNPLIMMTQLSNTWGERPRLGQARQRGLGHRGRGGGGP